MPNIYAQEDWINKTEGYRSGESGVYETRFDTTGEAYKGFQELYGRCTGKVYVDDPSGKPKQVGWVFVKRQKYDDSKDTFLLETWVTLHDAAPVRSIHYNYTEIQ